MMQEREAFGQPKKYQCDYCGSVFWHVEHPDQSIDCPSCGAPNPKVVAISPLENILVKEETIAKGDLGIGASMNFGVVLIVEIILFSIVGYALAFSFPSWLSSFATSALVNPNHSTIALITEIFQWCFVGTIAGVGFLTIRQSWKILNPNTSTVQKEVDL